MSGNPRKMLKLDPKSRLPVPDGHRGGSASRGTWRTLRTSPEPLGVVVANRTLPARCYSNPD